ncbi:MAG: polysaccharide biosynthesis protein [Candidatus Omnitrophica bacterium]|nr:polysaccharide biosynthesis protein [Candidatus Omnitrophota bacterium]
MSLKLLILNYRRYFIAVFHLLLIAAAYILAFYLRFDFNISNIYWQVILKTFPVLVGIKMIFFGYFGLFTGLWRYAGVADIWRIIKVHVLSLLCCILAFHFIFGLTGFPRSIFFLDCIISFCFVAGIRFFTRLFREKYRPVPGSKRKKAIIIGAGDAGVLVLRDARSNPKTNIEIVGFIDDDPAKKNVHIQGVRILGTQKDIPAVVNKYGVDEVIISIPSAKGEAIRSIIANCEVLSVKIRIVPGLQKILSGELEVRPRDVQPEDLLGRETVIVNEGEISNYLSGKVVLVTGAGGSIGSCLCRQIVTFAPKEVLFFDYNENDIYYLSLDLRKRYPQIVFRNIIGDVKDIGLLKNVFSLYKPEVVFHAAAHKHVPLMEENPVAAAKNNVIGSRNLIYAADHYKVDRFILISTDKAVNPTNVMGATKRVTEMILQSKAKGSGTKFMAVRFGNVLGSNGSVVPLFKKQIEGGGPITLTHPDVTRYFMSITEASQLVLQAGSMGKAGEIFILDMGEQIKILDLAKELITLYGLKPEEDIKIEFIGLRPGEKLFEETLLNAEKDQATKADKIYIAQSRNFDPRALRRDVKELEKLINVMDAPGVVRKLQEIIAA